MRRAEAHQNLTAVITGSPGLLCSVEKRLWGPGPELGRQATAMVQASRDELGLWRENVSDVWLSPCSPTPPF